MTFPVKIKKLRDGALIPSYATDGSAAADLCSAAEHPITIGPGETCPVPTGIAISMGTRDMVALVYARSGLATKKGIAPANCVGVIDSDYRGEILVSLRNHSSEPFTVEPGDRIAQLMFTPVFTAAFEETDNLDETLRGDGGFGSTGMKQKQ